jgi:hypothetical protein
MSGTLSAHDWRRLFEMRSGDALRRAGSRPDESGVHLAYSEAVPGVRNAAGAERGTPDQAANGGCPTLAQVLRALPSVGAQRLVQIALQLATELDLAEQSGLACGSLTPRTVQLERAGTPFEQAIVPRSTHAEQAGDLERQLLELGGIIGELLRCKRVFLEGSIWLPPGWASDVVMTRRADVDMLVRICRALTLIARRCAGQHAARYTSAHQLAHDLAKLAAITSRIVSARRSERPRLGLQQPKPRLHTSEERLPKVIVTPEEPSQPQRGEPHARARTLLPGLRPSSELAWPELWARA